jgi:hypothetical protein
MRLWQAHAELDNYALEFSSRNNINFTTSSARARTGSYAFRTAANGHGTVQLGGAYSQLRCGFHVNHGGVALGDAPHLVRLRSAGSEIVGLRLDVANGLVELLLDGDQVASAGAGALAHTDEWVHVGLDVKLAAAGWVHLYINGVETIAHAGNTAAASGTVNGADFGSISTFQQWANYLYLDDLYIDSTSGESSAAPPDDLRWQLLRAHANGSHSEWTGSDADQVDNYQLVDEVAPDADASYVRAVAPGLRDTYGVETFSLPSGFSVRACGPLVVAKKSDAGVATQLALVTQLDGGETVGDARDLSTDYAAYWARNTATPGGGSWSESDVNGAEFGMASAGEFG